MYPGCVREAVYQGWCIAGTPPEGYPGSPPPPLLFVKTVKTCQNGSFSFFLLKAVKTVKAALPSPLTVLTKREVPGRSPFSSVLTKRGSLGGLL